MRIKDSHKGNAEGGRKKEGKRKGKQKAEINGKVISHKNEKPNAAAVKTEKEHSKRSPAKDETVPEVYQIIIYIKIIQKKHKKNTESIM